MRRRKRFKSDSTRADYCICSCGKRGYSSKSLARHAVRTSGERIRVYRCTGSGSWHQTSMRNYEEVAQ